MSDEKEMRQSLALETVSLVRLDALMQELTKRVMVVNEDGLKHLQERGVIASAARDGCCKPDGGTCCPNKRTRFDRIGGVQGER